MLFISGNSAIICVCMGVMRHEAEGYGPFLGRQNAINIKFAESLIERAHCMFVPANAEAYQRSLILDQIYDLNAQAVDIMGKVVRSLDPSDFEDRKYHVWNVRLTAGEAAVNIVMSFAKIMSTMDGTNSVEMFRLAEALARKLGLETMANAASSEIAALSRNALPDNRP